MPLWKKVILGLILGVIFGLLLQDKALYIKPFGDIFIRMIKMIIAPLIFLAILSGITNIEDPKTLGRVGIKAAFAYLMATLSALTIGILVGNIFRPGDGIFLSPVLQKESLSEIPIIEKISQAVFSIMPENIIQAMSEGNILQIVFFAIFCGITINTMESEHSKKIKDIIKVLALMVFKMVHHIVKLSPLAAFALTAWMIGAQGLVVLANLLKLVGSVYFAFLVQYLFFGLMIYFWAKLSPIPFYKKSLEYQAISFAASSSKAALPTTIKVCEERLGISSLSSSFVLPLGASMNMDGLAIYLSLSTIFFAQATGKILTWADYGLIMITGTFGSIGGAGIPGASIVMLPMVLGAVGLPIEGVALLTGVDRIIDMMRTTISITGDATVALCLDQSEGLLSKTTYEKQC